MRAGYRDLRRISRTISLPMCLLCALQQEAAQLQINKLETLNPAAPFSGDAVKLPESVYMVIIEFPIYNAKKKFLNNNPAQQV